MTQHVIRANDLRGYGCKSGVLLYFWRVEGGEERFTQEISDLKEIIEDEEAQVVRLEFTTGDCLVLQEMEDPLRENHVKWLKCHVHKHQKA